jgi:DNA-binding beta-propeller fold protein YncE
MRCSLNLFVVEHDAERVSVIEISTLKVHTLAVGTAPTSVAVNPYTRQAYVTNSGSATVSVIE